MCSAQLNARAVGRVFNLFPQTVFIVSDDGSVELPDEDGSFNKGVGAVAAGAAIAAPLFDQTKVSLL